MNIQSKQCRGLRERGQKATQTSFSGLREQGRAILLHNPYEPLRIALPLRIVSEQNCREHWARKARRVKQQRNAVAAALATPAAKAWFVFHRSALYFVVDMVRIGKKKLDSDGCVAGFKAVRDAIANAIHIDDGDELRWQWNCSQRIEKRFACEITIEAVEG